MFMLLVLIFATFSTCSASTLAILALQGVTAQALLLTPTMPVV